ncbi:hypothetical protein BRAS3809_2480024 [Bradyrhizobium sp. STM 3809]|nr:hypothetical protein BRAS3809_2480024 [Bradyrhizobium sp. STM 3809]
MYYVYILVSGRHGTLHIGITNSIRARLEQHRNGAGSDFVKKYNVFRLVYIETYAVAKKQSPARSSSSAGSATGRSS